MQVMRNGSTSPQPKAKRREELFAMLVDDTSTPRFVRITDSVGKPFEYRKAAAVCGVRVSPDVVSFALTRLTKNTAKALAGQPVEIPRTVLARVERHAPKAAPQGNQLVVQVLVVDDEPVVADDLEDLFEAPAATENKRPNLVNKTWTLSWEADDAGIVSLETEDPGQVVNLSKGAVKATVFLYSAAAGRVLGVSFVGHLAGVPGQPETPERIAAQILHSMAYLPEFRMLSGIQDVRIPARPSGLSGRSSAPVIQDADVSAYMPVALFASTSDPAPLAAGRVKVSMDLNSAPERLLFHITPDERLLTSIDLYLPQIQRYVSAQVEGRLGPANVNQARIDITLGELSTGMIEELREAILVLVPGACFTPTEAAPMPPQLAQSL